MQRVQLDSIMSLYVFRYGFVRFSSDADAQRILDSVGGPGGTRNIDGRDVKINYAHKKG